MNLQILGYLLDVDSIYSYPARSPWLQP